MVQVASQIAVAEGLDKVTAKRIAAELGVFPGLVAHYFTADELVAAAFACAAAAERDEVFGRAVRAGDPVAQVRALLADWLHTDRDSVSLLWLDAWQASRRRPALLAEVDRQMQLDLVRLTRLIDSGISTAVFAAADDDRRHADHESDRRAQRAGGRTRHPGLLSRPSHGRHHDRTAVTPAGRPAAQPAVDKGAGSGELKPAHRRSRLLCRVPQARRVRSVARPRHDAARQFTLLVGHAGQRLEHDPVGVGQVVSA